jgi:6-phosphogluconolactonase
MELHRCETPDDVAAAGAEFIYARAMEAIGKRDQFTLALSGGSTPWRTLSKLSERDLPWECVKIAQVDERIAPDGDKTRNLVGIQQAFAGPAGLPAENLYAMPVVDEQLDRAARQYEHLLIGLAGDSPVLDVVQLGLGGDGHTASLIPGDPVLSVSDRDVTTTGFYNGQRRMTLTYPIINRARRILWLVTGEGKAEMLSRMMRADREIPAGRINQQEATIVADAAALSVHDQNQSGKV